MRLNIKSIVSKNKLVVFILLIGIFLRLYRLPEFTMFLSDQGRDAIIVRNILTLKHFPAIGAPTSLGEIYLGPFYYYLIAPFLLLFNFNPVGMSYGVAFLSIVGIILSYFLVRKEFNKPIALFFLVLISFFSINIDQSRFSWNPNLLPFFSFFTLYFLYQTIKTKKIIDSFLFGALLSFSLQLHYLSLTLMLVTILFILIHSLTLKITLLSPSGVKDNKLFPKPFSLLTSFFSFLLFSFPLLIFDLRHQFLNSKNFIKFFTQSDLTHTAANSYIILIIFIIGLFIFFMLKKNNINDFLVLNTLNIFIFLVGFILLKIKPLPHYFSSVYLSCFLLAALILNRMPKKIAIFLLFIYILINVKQYNFLYQQGANQIAHSRKVAEFLADKIGNQPFNIATWPVSFTEDNYIYFLELKGIYPADRKKVEITNQLFVLCNQEPCQILNSPSWNIAMFGPAKIDKIWKFEGIKIYKLVHK